MAAKRWKNSPCSRAEHAVPPEKCLAAMIGANDLDLDGLLGNPQLRGDLFLRASFQFAEDIHLAGAAPHMHYRGKAMELKAFYPDGRSEVLLNVPRYDFSWQTMYYFKNPVAIPRGTRLLLTAVFDNSAKNLNNPDATKMVRWGDQTWEEMMIGFVDYTYLAK